MLYCLFEHIFYTTNHRIKAFQSGRTLCCPLPIEHQSDPRLPQQTVDFVMAQDPIIAFE